MYRLQKIVHFYLLCFRKYSRSLSLLINKSTAQKPSKKCLLNQHTVGIVEELAHITKVHLH